MRILFDTNVVLDVFLNRDPFVEFAAHLFEANARGDLEGILGATTVTTIYYLLDSNRGNAVAREKVEALLRLFDVAAVNRQVLVQAAESGFADYEDAVLHSAARTTGADGIVTRNTADFSTAALAVYAPAELLTILDDRRD
ncbi:PIN domain-containing protein [Salinibacter altiplanensis]|uniref:PIN domain-containing protein n=1 Tax=Salinibacter altiplanensis TaxID=1803181 RepID=UPI000C9FEC68|nr:PIN domain-containing protein [Salinibacter altiplanensis]